MDTMSTDLLAKPFVDSLDRYLDRVGRNVAGGNKICSKQTRKKRRYVLLRGFALLTQLGCRLQSPENFSEKHMHLLGRALEKKGMSPAYIVNVISTFRIFASWIGKKGMIGKATKYVENVSSVQRSTVARQNRGWRAHGIDVKVVIEQARRYDNWLGLYLKLMAYFGLRLLEAISFRPFNDILPDGDAITVREGTKGGRLRLIRVRTSEQRDALEEALQLSKTNRGSLLIRGKTLRQNYQKFQYLFRMLGITKHTLGVTVHGLRHDFAQDEYRAITGKLTPIEGRDPKNISRDQHRYATLQVMEKLGHSRDDIGKAYYGSYGHALRPRRDITEDKNTGCGDDDVDSDDSILDEPPLH